MDAWRYGLIIAGWRKCCDTFLRRGSNPPPPVGGKRLPSPGPPWRVPDKQRQDRPPPGTIVELGPDEPAPVWPQPSAVPANDDLALLLARLLTEALNELFEVTRDPDRQRSEIEAVRKSIQARASAAIDASTDPQPLTADEVRKIVREEIQRAMRTVGKRGKMWPG